MDGCDYCGRPKPGMTHTDAPWKAFCSDECFYAWQVQTLKAYQPPIFEDKHDLEFRKPAKHQPVNQMSLF